MQRQAVPLVKSEAPLVGTGLEYRAALDSGAITVARRAGRIVRVSADEIAVQTVDNKQDIYRLKKFSRSNQGTCFNQKPIVSKGQIVEEGDVLAELKWANWLWAEISLLRTCPGRVTTTKTLF